MFIMSESIVSVLVWLELIFELMLNVKITLKCRLTFRAEINSVIHLVKKWHVELVFPNC